MSNSETLPSSDPHGAQSVRWDLSDLYESLSDPKLETDLKALLAAAVRLPRPCQGNHKSELVSR